jgi:hypothetical protein
MPPAPQLAFTALSDVERLRGCVSSNSRYVDEPLDAGPVSLSCDAFGGLNMNRIKCFVAALDVKADRIDHPVAAGDRMGD